MGRNRQRGSVLITLIVAIMLIGVLGVGIYNLTTSSTFTGLLTNNNDQAYQLAQAGIRYKIRNLSSASGDFLMPDDKHKFNIAYNETTKIITSTGIVNEGSFFETRRVITYDIHNYWKVPDTDPYGNITFRPDTKANKNKDAAIRVNADGTISLGGDTGDSFGSLWYQGSSSAGNCNSGACAFNYGLRAYFDFTSAEDNSSGSTDRGDGFTFTVLSAINNTRDRTGGAPSDISIGELLGYAGPGNTSDGLGLKPPKMAVEFDTYPNTDGNLCGAGGRNDHNGGGGSSFLNHMAILFWGDALTGFCGSYPDVSYDDNRHESGSGDTGSTPVNSYSGYAGGGYFEGTKSNATSNCLSASGTTCNWMEDGHTYHVRIEIIRNTSGTSGLYQLKAWIFRDTQTPGSPSQFSDLTNPYTSDLPIIRTVTLSSSDHDALRQVFFGITEGTGGKNQNVTISNLKAFFPQTPTCLTTISPLSQAVVYGGATGQTVTVAAGAGCPWNAVSNNAWLAITGGASGAGPGTVTFDVAPNAGAPRSGAIAIAGQTFVVNQAGAPCPSLSILTPSPANGIDNVSYSTSISATGGSGTLSYSLSSGTLPPGLSLNSSTGEISGTPTTAGTWNNIRVTVTDTCWSGAQLSQTGNFSIRIQYNPYRVYAGRNMYYKIGGSCYYLGNGNYVNLTYDNAATFYRYSGCTGSNLTVTYSNAYAADTNANGRVEVNRNGDSWSLDDY